MSIREPWPSYTHNIFNGEKGNVEINLSTWEVIYPEGLDIPEVTKFIFDGLKSFARNY